MKAMGISTGSASKVLQHLIKSRGKGSDGWLTRGQVTRKTITAHGQTLDRVLVTETRCCRQRGGEVPEDLRVLQPIEVFGDFGEDGRLNSSKVCDTDTPLQTKVKRARLTRMEVVAVVLYTGTLLASDMRCHALVYMSHECTIELRNFFERHSSLHFVLNESSLSPMTHA